MSPYMECRYDNITYVFCILNDTLLASWQRSMIKLSNVYPYALKSMKQKNRPNGSWYLLIVNVFKSFNFGMWWWYSKFLEIRTIGMAFLRRPSSSISWKLMWFILNWLKWIKRLMGDELSHYPISIWHLQKIYFLYGLCCHWKLKI
jgi:hypothetical protein